MESAKSKARKEKNKGRNKRRADRENAEANGAIFCTICNKKKTNKKGLARSGFRKVFVRSNAGEKGAHGVCVGVACPTCFADRVDNTKSANGQRGHGDPVI